MPTDITNLTQLLDVIENSTCDRERISLGTIVGAVGGRSFGPLLLMAGVITASPVSGIPGMPTSMGIVVLLIAVQLLLRRQYFWLPRWLLKRSVAREKVCKGLAWLRPLAGLIDRCLRPRLGVFIEKTGTYLIAIICMVLAAAAPMMELVPFSIHGTGIALTAFGLALISRDGLLALITVVFTAGLVGTAAYQLLTSPDVQGCVLSLSATV